MKRRPATLVYVRRALSGLALSALVTATIPIASAESLLAPDVTIVAAPTTVISGGGARLTWQSRDATACIAAGSWSGSLPTSGARLTGPVTKTSDYEVRCTGPGGTATQSVSITVAVSAPVVLLSTRPSTVGLGGAATLTWSATDATSCKASGAWVGAQPVSGSQSAADIKSDATYTLTCTGAGGSTSQSATVSVAAPAPTLSLSARPSTIAKGDAARLIWSSANATSCTASGAWSGSKAASGSVLTAALSADATFTLNCAGIGGKAAQSETVTVGSVSAPIVNLSAGPSTVKMGASSTLNWSATNATSCAASGAWSGSKSIHGSQSTNALETDATYTLTCTGTGGSAVQSTTVSVTAPAPTVHLEANRSSVSKSDSTTLDWESTNATSCTASGAWSGARALRGSQSTGALSANATYVLTCVGTGGSAAQSATISVTGPAPTIRLLASPSTVESGANSKLIWTTTNATSCTASGAWSGGKLINGSQSTAALSANAIYTLTCSGVGGTATQSEMVTVGSGLGARVKLSADPSTVKSAASTTLTWSSANATSCTASGGWSGAKSINGSQSTGTLKADQTYTLTCSGAGGSATQLATVLVAASAPTISLSADSSTVRSGASSTLTWSSTHATSCTASGAWSGSKSINGSQSTGALKADQIYTLTCSGVGGSASESATVSVVAPAPAISLHANPSTVKSGLGSTLIWSSTHATSCTAGGDWAGSKSVSGSQSTGALSANSTYALTCTGAGGNATQSTTMSVTAATPTVSLSVGPSVITSGGSSTLTWSSTNATSCSASGAWSGSKATHGSQSTGDLKTDSTFTLTCGGTGGSASQSATVAVKSPPPTVSLSANPSTIASGDSSTLNWSATNATVCTASSAWSGTKATSGSQSTGVLKAGATYTLSCSGTGGSASQSATVTVTAPAPIARLSANPNSVKSGARSTLNWSSSNATSCTASGGWSGNEGTLGSQTTAALTVTTKFTLTCIGSGGRASQSATVTVSAASDPGGSATLSWVAPTLNTNGSELTTLTGYHIYYGNSANALTQSIAITNAAATTYQVTNLAPGTWYFAVAADSSDGTESSMSNVSSKTF